jgi:HEXXH motif-containing protein
MRPDTIDIGSEVSRRIEAGEAWWFPGLAERLVARFWSENSRPGLAGYSTATWLGLIGAPTVPVPRQPSMALESLPEIFVSRFEAPLFADSALDAAQAIALAMERLRPGGVAKVVATLARSVHCVAARGAGYDSSHSEPTIPFSVFVSIPSGEPYASLRLAESLLHEAMHLQLTLIEHHQPLVGADFGSGYSPWRQCERPVQGLIHGLYVFTVIQDWLLRLAADPALPIDDRTYVATRLGDIEAEVAQVAFLATSPGLTKFGRRLAQSLLRAPGRRGCARVLGDILCRG